MSQPNVFIRRHSIVRLVIAMMFLPVLLLWSGCGVGATAAADSPLQKQQDETATGVVSAQFFGMVVKTAGNTPAVATGSRRLWDAGVSWAALEPAPGSFDWQVLDAEVSAAEQQGQQVVLTLGMTPEWASSEPQQASAYGNGATAMPAQISDWDVYVAAVAARYAGRIAAYEVWNAPEDTAYWTGDPTQAAAEMATLAEHAAAAVHAADAAALVVSPALSPGGLAAFLAAGGGASVDAIGSTLDSPGQAPEMMTAALQSLRGVMAGTAADGKPVWNEQAAWALPQGGLDEDTQAAYVARAVLLNAGYGVARMHWYAWDDHAEGSLALTDGSGQPTQAALAYGEVENWLAGAAMNGCSASAEEVWTCQIVRGGKTGWVVWSATGTASSSTFGAATERDLGGNVTAIAANASISVGASPVLLQ